MKKLQRWFNALPVKRQKLWLVIFCLVFTLLLLLSIGFQQFNLNTGQILQPRIKTETLKHH